MFTVAVVIGHFCVSLLRGVGSPALDRRRHPCEIRCARSKLFVAGTSMNTIFTSNTSWTCTFDGMNISRVFCDMFLIVCRAC